MNFVRNELTARILGSLPTANPAGAANPGQATVTALVTVTNGGSGASKPTSAGNISLGVDMIVLGSTFVGVLGILLSGC
jgi:hypothetical protein